MKRCSRLVTSVAAAALVAASACEVVKSENPLSPSIAGPIPGVEITPPRPLEPPTGRTFKPKEQPVTLTFENASTSGVRPLYYRLELAADAGFTSMLFTNPSLTPGGDGRTSLTLTDTLPTDRTYYWRVRAEDGANTGPFAAVTHFVVLAPVIIQPPGPLEPIGNGAVTTTTAVLRVANASRTGPAGPITYRFEVARDAGFTQLVAAANVGEQAGQTSWSTAVAYSTSYFWRVKASDPDESSPWSALVAFSTTAAPPAPTPGGSCGSTQPQGILECRRSQYGAHMSSGEVVAFLRGSASDINKAGTAGGPWGLLVKTGGLQCDGYSCDILCMGNGSSQVQRDVLLDSDGAQVPVWGAPMTGSQIAVRPCEAQ